MAGYSESLLEHVRGAMSRRGWNTAALAKEMGRHRKDIRRVLGGQEPLLVEDFFAMVETLGMKPGEMGLTPEALAGVGSDSAGDGQDVPDEPREPAGQPALVTDDAPWVPDPDGVQAAEILKLGFRLGMDISLVADARELEQSGVPEAVLRRHPEMLPIKLDAAYHRHNRPQFLPEGLSLRLSFDGVAECLFPWQSIRQVSFLPEPPDLEPGEPEPEPEPGPPHLRLIKG